MRRVLLGCGAVTTLSLAIGACWNPFADQSVILSVSELNAPATVTPGARFSVVLTVQTGGCLSFDRIVETFRDASGATLTAWGTDGSKGRKNVACPADVRYEPHSYELSPPFSNPFKVTVGRGRVSPLQAVVQVQ
jgi:hypothetical protein